MFELDEHHRGLAETARAVAASVAGHADEADDMLTVHPVMREALRESGLPELCVVNAFGGRSDKIDPLAITVVREALMAESAHLDGLFGMQGIGSYALSLRGHPSVQERWLPRVARLDAIAALALTEPEVGSDLKAITTTVVQDGDGLVVTGEKSFITNAGAADFYTVLAREGEGYSLVLVPADTPGVSVEIGPRLIAPHIMGAVSFAGARVPATHRIGDPGTAFKLVLTTLATFRVSVAGAAVGLAQAALDEVVRHTNTRSQFGARLAELGPIPHFVGTTWVEVESARLLTYQAAARAAADPLAALDRSSMAKVAATEAAARATDRAVQFSGRFGLVTGTKVERLYRNARPMRVYEGGNEVLTGQLAKRLAKLSGY
ncbi:acyl-CoA dehydrogenase family protein [Actinokineospora pegani]|uniref:acyl-CoA dehydrogenase family protein n=1 Tax=Actinokineospora pegani TaxID=2654637 RepID=UPI0012EA0FA7|nr:acyl-CoA dehydrogenase family protein [Actinokineospora pegani]